MRNAMYGTMPINTMGPTGRIMVEQKIAVGVSVMQPLWVMQQSQVGRNE